MIHSQNAELTINHFGSVADSLAEMRATAALERLADTLTSLSAAIRIDSKSSWINRQLFPKAPVQSIENHPILTAANGQERKLVKRAVQTDHGWHISESSGQSYASAQSATKSANSDRQSVSTSSNH